MCRQPQARKTYAFNQEGLWRDQHVLIPIPGNATYEDAAEAEYIAETEQAREDDRYWYRVSVIYASPDRQCMHLNRAYLSNGPCMLESVCVFLQEHRSGAEILCSVPVPCACTVQE